jgi:hypothetical protein
MDDGDIQVRIEGEDDAADSSTSRIEALNRQADADRAKTARMNLQTAHMRREADLRRVGNELLTVDSETKAAEAAYRNAREYGDTDAEVAATRRLSAAEARRNTLELQSQTLERMPVSSGDPLEDHFSRFTDRTAAWMRRHKDWVTDPRKNAKVTGAHSFAVSEGLTPDTDEYFEFVEKMIGLRGNSGSSNGSARSGSMQRETKINPGDFNSHVTDDGRVYLTENEKKIAQDGTLVHNHGPLKGKPLGLQEFARIKREQIKAGLHNKLG